MNKTKPNGSRQQEQTHVAQRCDNGALDVSFPVEGGTVPVGNDLGEILGVGANLPTVCFVLTRPCRVPA